MQLFVYFPYRKNVSNLFGKDMDEIRPHCILVLFYKFIKCLLNFVRYNCLHRLISFYLLIQAFPFFPRFLLLGLICIYLSRLNFYRKASDLKINRHNLIVIFLKNYLRLFRDHLFLRRQI